MGFDQAAAAQPSYHQGAYAENNHMNPSTHQGYAAREGLAPSTPATKATKDNFGFMKNTWPAAYMLVIALQAIICIAFEAYVFGKFQSSLGTHVNTSDVQSQYLTVPTFFTLFMFGFLYECVVVWDALRMTNTIQVIGVCIANLALLVYTAIQIDQIHKAIKILGINNALEAGLTYDSLWTNVKPYLVAIPIIIAIATLGLAFIAWKLYQEFAWDVLKIIGADYRMKRRFLHYQIYIALLKFDFFFFLGFIIQFVVVVAKKNDPEFALTIATIPVTIVILLAAAYFTRHENKLGMVCVIVLYLGGLSYFVFKLVRIYEPGYREYYEAVKRSLTAFAVITILLIVLTITNAIICMRNFGSGLKQHFFGAGGRVPQDTLDLAMEDEPGQHTQPTRMVIE